MGCAPSTPESADSNTAANSKKIDKQIEIDKKNIDDSVRLLLLGPGESGKSTVLKQMKLLYNDGFSAQEVQVYRSAIFLNILQNCKVLIEAMRSLKIPYGFDEMENSPQDSQNNVDSEEVVAHGGPLLAVQLTRTDTKSKMIGKRLAAEGSGLELLRASFEAESESSSAFSQSSVVFPNVSHSSIVADGRKASYDSIARRAKQKYKDIMVNGGESGPVVGAADLLKNPDTEMFGYNKDATLPQDIIRAIHLLWSDSGIQYCYKRANEYQLMDSCAYFMEALDRICSPAYTPSDQDILVVRIMTVAVTETHFTLPTFSLTVYDVGGQRTERKKWAPYFDNAQAIIFVVAVGAFDQVCLEDSETNRLVESMNLFGSVCNHPLFKSTDMILFLNKIDILKEKLEKKKQVSTYFSGYSGDNSFESVSKYFSNRFLDLNKYPTSKQIYVHLTFATDVHTFRKVLASVQDSIFKNTLKEMNMM
ncbi:hypothetical protein HDU79_000820 [Rhizoclosmatium sp. JEL0117]|nr:hypothetical protein HDU79_000820 [Rhizoclosmatium sp. JEL0117]